MYHIFKLCAYMCSYVLMKLCYYYQPVAEPSTNVMLTLIFLLMVTPLLITIRTNKFPSDSLPLILVKLKFISATK